MICWRDLPTLLSQPAHPDWLVDDLIPRGSVVMLSGDTGSAKSLAAQALTVAIVTGGEWLGRPVRRGRVLYVDEENGDAVVSDRFRGLGLSEADCDALRYAEQQSLALGTSDADDSLQKAVFEFRPDLLVIDTVSSATMIEVNDNAAVSRFYSDLIRPIAREYGCAVLLLHHERKLPQQGYRDPSQAAMGARQWVGQVDLHLTIEKQRGERYSASEDCADGRFDVFRFLLSNPKRRHGGKPHPVTSIEVTSIRGRDGILQWLRVEAVDQVERQLRASLADRIVKAVADAGEATRGEIADAVAVAYKSGTLDRGLREAQDRGLIRKVGRQYACP